MTDTDPDTNPTTREELLTQAEVVRRFIAQRAEYETACRNCSPENDADLWRWRGHIEARKILLRDLAALDQAPS